jgi:soluble lytic murein transglycosylase-like protein
LVSIPSQYAALVDQAAKGTGLPQAVVAAQINEESGFQPNALSPAGAEGMFQFLPSTYDSYSSQPGTEDDPSVEVLAYIAFMKALLAWSGGNVQKALAAYNAGQGNWQAGLGYANTILDAAGQSPGVTATQSGASANTGSTPGATTDSFNPFGWTKDIANIEFGWFGKLITGTVGTPFSLGDIATSLSGLVQALTKFLQLFLLLFRPEFWLRVGAFFAGVMTLGAAMFFLKSAL